MSSSVVGHCIRRPVPFAARRATPSRTSSSVRALATNDPPEDPHLRTRAGGCPATGCARATPPADFQGQRSTHGDTRPSRKSSRPAIRHCRTLGRESRFPGREGRSAAAVLEGEGARGLGLVDEGPRGLEREDRCSQGAAIGGVIHPLIGARGVIPGCRNWGTGDLVTWCTPWVALPPAAMLLVAALLPPIPPVMRSPARARCVMRAPNQGARQPQPSSAAPYRWSTPTRCATRDLRSLSCALEAPVHHGLHLYDEALVAGEESLEVLSPLEVLLGLRPGADRLLVARALSRRLVRHSSDQPNETQARQNCHAGGRGFESRRSRPLEPFPVWWARTRRGAA